jgi:transcriptional regulator with XRE-family HTH domain
MNIGQAIKTTRRQRKMNQQEMAEAAGITQTAISQLEAGVKQPRPETVVKLAKALGVSVGYLYIMAIGPEDMAKPFEQGHAGFILTKGKELLLQVL